MQQLAPVTLASLQERIEPQLEAAYDELCRIVVTDFPLVADVNSHLLRLKGKMFRPTLLLLSAEAVGGGSKREETLAATVELIHLATLVHDDSVDHSVLRRGQPTVNSAFSHQVAVIMGDYLYSRAILELVSLDDPRPLQVMAMVTNEMTIGEMRELEAFDRLSYDQESYDALIRSKTASLMSGACEVGALAGDGEHREYLKRYGMLLGMAFQVTDDVIDYTESESVTGKPSGLDLREHKVTLPLIAALPNMSASERALVNGLMADPEPSEDVIAAVVDVVSENGGIGAARDRAAGLARDAAQELEHVPDGAAKEGLRDCLTYAIERHS